MSFLALKSLTSLGLFLLAGEASAQDRVQPMHEESRQRAPEGAAFVTAFSISDHRGVWITEVFSYPDLTRPQDGVLYPRLFIARRALDNPDGQEQITWATAQDCPTMYGVLQGFVDLTAPRLNLPSLHGVAPAAAIPMPAPSVPTEASTYSVWGYGKQPDGAPAYLSATASAGLLANFVIWADTALATCWQSEQPLPPAR